MNYKHLVCAFCVIGVTIAAPVQAQEEDITPYTRDAVSIAEQFAVIQLQFEKIKSLMAASVVTAESQFIVTIDEITVVSKPTAGMTRQSAQAQCEAIAYNTAYMWKLVTCTYGTDVLYQDVFIAG